MYTVHCTRVIRSLCLYEHFFFPNPKATEGYYAYGRSFLSFLFCVSWIQGTNRMEREKGNANCLNQSTAKNWYKLNRNTSIVQFNSLILVICGWRQIFMNDWNFWRAHSFKMIRLKAFWQQNIKSMFQMIEFISLYSATVRFFWNS